MGRGISTLYMEPGTSATSGAYLIGATCITYSVLKEDRPLYSNRAGFTVYAWEATFRGLYVNLLGFKHAVNENLSSQLK